MKKLLRLFSENNTLQHVVSIGILLVVSFIPLLWYQKGTLALGHDMGWSLVPLERYVDRLSAWARLGFGYDQSLEMGTAVYYGFQAIYSWFGLSIIWVQKLTFIFWFFAPATAMYYCIYTLYQGKYRKAVAVLAATFYVMNHFTLQAWTVAELAKFSMMTLLPLLVASIWQVIDKKMKFFTGVAFAAFASLVFNGGGGAGLALSGGTVLILGLVFLYKWLVEKKSLIRILGVYISFCAAIIAINAYIFIPLINVIHSQYSPFAQSGGPEQELAWTDVISKNTSILNLFRLQGFSSWYDTTNHPYAYFFLHNPILIILSILIPIMVFSAILLAKNTKEKSLVIFFSFIALFAIFFTAGTHDPLGGIYGFLMTHVYGFSIYRTAFYKFGYSLWFSYAFLFSYTLVRISSFIKWKYASVGIFLVGCVVLGIYNYPFFTGVFFNFDQPFKTRVELPQYILDSSKYVASLPSDSRILMVPPPSPTNGEVDIYNFGYFSRTPLPFEITQKSFVTNVEINTDDQEKSTEALYKAIQANDEKTTRSLIDTLGITHLLVRQDVLTTNPVYRIIPTYQFSKILSTYTWLRKEKQFGNWSFYSVVGALGQFEAASPVNAFVSQSGNTLSLTKDSNIVYVSNDYKQLVPLDYTVQANCSTCDNTGVKRLPELKEIHILPTSPLYLISQWIEKRNLKRSASSPYILFGYDIFYAEKHVNELNLIAAQLKGSTTSQQLDQEQRYQLFKTYQNRLQQARDSFHALSDIEKVQLAKEVNASLVRQQEALHAISSSDLLNDITDTYFAAIDTLNSFISDPELTQALSYRNHYYIYSVDIPRDGTYAIQIPGLQNAQFILDGKTVNAGDIQQLSKGSHRIDLPIPEPKNLLTSDDILLSTSSQAVVPLSGLKPSKRYRFSFDVTGQNIAGIESEIKDDFGQFLTGRVLTGEKFSHVDLYFGTPSTVGGNYNFSVAVDKQDGTDLQAKISNIGLFSDEFPKVTFTNSSTASSVTNIPVITWKYLSPTHYLVSVQNATDPFLLAFKETFSPLWTLRVNGKPITNHFSDDNTFNEWLVDDKGNYTLDLSFDAQNTYLRGLVISGGVAVILLIGLFIQKKRYDK